MLVSLAGTGRRQDADNDVAQLNLPGGHPRPRLGPQLVAVGAVGIGEDIDHTRAVPTVRNPMACFELSPGSGAGRAGFASLGHRGRKGWIGGTYRRDNSCGEAGCSHNVSNEVSG